MARELGWGFTHKLCYARCCACCFRLPFFRFSLSEIMQSLPCSLSPPSLRNRNPPRNRHDLRTLPTLPRLEYINTWKKSEHRVEWSQVEEEEIVRERDERQWKQIIGKCLFLWWMSSSRERICWFGWDESGNCWRFHWIGSDSRGLFCYFQLRVWISEQELDNELKSSWILRYWLSVWVYGSVHIKAE